MLGYVHDPLVKNAEHKERFKKAKREDQSARETNAEKKCSVGNADSRSYKTNQGLYCYVGRGGLDG